MKRKGFTLVELLAVIVILAIIALITMPIVSSVKKNARIGAAERSADNYIKAVDLLISLNEMNGNIVFDGKYVINENGDLSFGIVEVSGTKPVGGTVVVKDGQVVKNESYIQLENFLATYENGKATIKVLPKLLDVCNLAKGYTANTMGAKYTCDLGDGKRIFYILEQGTSSKAATLILEGNYDMETLAWCASGNDNSCAGDGLTGKLDSIAEAWSKLDRSQIGIPSASQIVVADGREEDAYLDYPKISKLWLYSYPAYEGWYDGENPPFGYWTSTPSAGVSNYAWRVYYDGGVNYNSVHFDFLFGVRPVVTLSI